VGVLVLVLLSVVVDVLPDCAMLMLEPPC
jgi:hypothetical protein